MLRKPQFSLGYLLLELTWIALAIGLTRVTYLSWNYMQPRPWVYTIPAAVFVVPTACFGLFGQMRVGAILGVCAMGVYCFLVLLCGFPADYDRTDW